MGEAEAPAGSWHGKRVLTIDGAPAFEMSYWCGTCPLIFQRLEGANRTLSMDALTEQLDAGLGQVDTSVVEAVAQVLEEGDYLPLLLEIHPELVFPGADGDYFSYEQVNTWGIDAFWGLPESPRTPYYRMVTRVVNDDARLFEFVVPMVPPSWNDRDRVDFYVDRLSRSSQPTCVALGVLDIRQRAVWDTPEGADTKWAGLTHWGLAHYLLDGHHKIEAAARSGHAVRVLSLISLESSLASKEDIVQLPAILTSAQVGQD